MDFAPYQDTAPEQERAKSPPPRSLSRSPNPRSPPPQRNIADPLSVALPPPSHFGGDVEAQAGWGVGGGSGGRGGGNGGIGGGGGNGGNGGTGGGFEGGSRAHVDLFETSLPMRMDHEAMMAYLLLPPAGGVLLLVLEHRSDYVRFHAWQSSMLFAAMFVVHLVFSFSAVLSWMLFVVDVALIVFLTGRAYRDADTLDRWEMPFFGRLASSFVDDE